MIGNKRIRLFTYQILYVKFYFEPYFDNFEATGLLFLEILAKNQQILMKTADISKKKNPVTSKLSPIDSKSKIICI